MSKEIWCEPTLGRNRERLIRRCQEAILSGRDRSFIYLIATRPLLDSVVSRIIDGERVRGCRQLQVYLFDGLVRRILLEAKLERDPIDDAIKHFLVEHVMGQLCRRGALKHIADIAQMPGCVESFGEIIGELKRAGKRPEEFRSFLQTIRASSRDEDVAEVYEAYQLVLQRRGLIDADDAYLIARDLISGEGRILWLENVESLFIDGFFDFTPIQSQLIRHLAQLIPEVIVNLSLDDRNQAVFVPVNETIKFFESLGFARASSDASAIQRRAELEVLPVHLFNPDAANFPIAPPVKIFSSPNVPHEVREIAKEIKRLVLEERYRPAEIAIIVRDPSRYVQTIQGIFAEEGIPCALDVREAVAAIPAVKAALKILDCRVGLEAVESYVSLIKNDYVDAFSPIDRDAVDNAIVAVGIDLSARDWLDRARRLLSLKRRDLESVRARLVDPEEAELEEIRLRRAIAELQAAITSIQQMRRHLELIPERGTIADFVRATEAALDAFHIRANLQRRLRKAASKGDAELSLIARDLRGLDKMSRLMRQVAQICSGPDLDPGQVQVREFKALLEHLLSRTIISLEKGDPAGVSILEAAQARGLSFRAVFVAGLVEGQFPHIPKSDWVYPCSERNRLAALGLYLEDLSPSLYQRKEEHLFYQCVCQATDRLYLSFPRALSDGEETVASSFIEEIRSLYRVGEESTLRIETKVAGEYDIRRVSSRAELAEALLANLWQRSEDETLLLKLYNYALENSVLTRSVFERLSMEEQRESHSFGPFDGVLKEPEILKELRRRFGSSRIYSASQFNAYGACPFQFFCKRVLRLDPRPEAKLDLIALDRGRLLHEILHAFLSHHVRSDEPLDLERHGAKLCQIAEDVFDRYEKSALPLHAEIWELEKAAILEDLFNFVEAEVAYQEKVQSLGVRPHWLELGFGMRDPETCHPESKGECLTLKLGQDEIKVRGRIDRVDRSRDGKYIAYDYKSGRGSTLRQMREGIDLQIPLYIMALRQLFLKPEEEVIGGGYYLIRSGDRSRGLYIRDYSSYTAIGRRAESNLEAAEWRQLLKLAESRMWEYVEGMRGGQFPVAPKLDSCCPRCDYRAVCRYDKHRIQSKSR